VIGVASGGSITFTITPDTNRIASVLVDGGSVGAVTSYTFTNVTANHTISASFPYINLNVTAPPAGGSYAQNSNLPITWTTGAAFSSGEFALWAQSASGTWYVGKLVANNGTAAYATNVTLSVPLASGYVIRVGYRPVAGSGAWTVYGLSGGSFTVAWGITVPALNGSYVQNSSLPVTWTTTAAVSTGEFAVWAQNAGGTWYFSKLVANNGTAAYATNVTLSVPLASGYRIRVGYRPLAGSGAWTVFGLSGGSFTVN